MLKHLWELFFPKTCCGCQIPLLNQENILCTTCRHNLPLTLAYKNPDNEMAQKFKGIVPIEFTASLFYFVKNHFSQEIIHQLKYKGNEPVGTMLGYWFAEDLKEVSILQSVDYIIPIPLHPKRLKKRGYNQVETFGKALSEVLQIPYSNKLLIKKKSTETQSKKNKLERQSETSDWFALTDTSEFTGKHFLLIDDVLTTGFTLETASRTLLQIPNSKVSIVTMAYARFD